MRTASRSGTAIRAALAVVLAIAPLAGCRSPFSDWDESGPKSDPQKIGAGVHGWPFYERSPGAGGVRTDVLWPLSSVRTNDDGTVRRASLLVPVVLWESDGTRSRFGVRPLFDVESDSKEGAKVSDVDLLFPIVKWRDAPGDSQLDIRPLWWSRSRETSEGHSEYTFLVPFWGSWSNPKSRGSYLFPFYGESAKGTDETRWYAAGTVIREEDPAKSLDSTKLLLGAVESTTWDDGSAWRAFPFVWHSEDASKQEEETFLVWPGLFGTSRTRDNRTRWAAPIWYDSESDDAKTTLLLPFWYSSESGEGDAASSTRVLFPIYGSQKSPGIERTFWGGNLLITTTTSTGGATDVVWPIFHESTDATGWDARLFPFVWLDRHEDRGYTHLFPVAGYEWNPKERVTSVAGPLFKYTSADDGWEASAPWPLVEFDRRGADRSTNLWPLVSHEWNEETGSYEGGVLGFVANWEASGTPKESGQRDGAPPRKPTSDFRILWRLVQDTDTGDRQVFAVNPLFRHETNTRGDDHWSALFGLISRTREAADIRWRFLWFLKV